ncbi:hypothetical protein [Macrococcus brunensis]|uniref:hypothetical protein n=1 Tax=Macrococcus brunensis TaxID=198483 RepID=UPI001EEF7B81|nr:hypothetical protein [Macrococcus brunensis]ULG74173.1 hypothetical protein MGG13_11185 [Macrococcus brunensis]
MTFSKISNLIIFILMTILIYIGYKVKFDISVFKGTSTALEAYINFSSISLGFLGTIISMVTVLSKQPFLQSVLSKKEAKADFILLGIMTLLSGFITIILAVSLTFIIGNENTGNNISLFTGNILIALIILYFWNFILFLIINLFSIFNDV